MIYKFDTDSTLHAKACLLLYAIYRSREKKTPLTGKQTWTRFHSFVGFSAEMAENVAQFVENLADKARCKSIVPKHLDNFQPRDIGNGEKISVDGIVNLDMSIFQEEDMLELFRNERVLLLTLVRWRIDQEALLKQFKEEEYEEEE